MSKKGQPTEPFAPDPHKTYGLMELAKGTSPLVDKEPEDTVMTFPNLVLIEFLGALGMILLLLLLSVLRDAPLEEFANPQSPPNPAKAAWYLMGVQELILHLHPQWGSILIPGAITVLLMAIPYLDRDTSDVGIWFGGARGRRIAGYTALATALTLPALILLSSQFGVKSILPNASATVTGIIVPVAIILVILDGLRRILRYYGATRREVIVAFFTVFITSFFVLTAIMLLFRGPGERLYWPWAMPTAE
ncbi:MAG: hypothetical protein GX605_12155 [Chloroflexi bacterium]|nr:hypothetical protein [Chloroflexota bacterium]